MLLLTLARDEPLLLAGSVSSGREVLGAGARLRGTLVTALHRSRSCRRGASGTTVERGSRGDRSDPAWRWVSFIDIAAGRQPKPTVHPQADSFALAWSAQWATRFSWGFHPIAQLYPLATDNSSSTQTNRWSMTKVEFVFATAIVCL